MQSIFCQSCCMEAARSETRKMFRMSIEQGSSVVNQVLLTAYMQQFLLYTAKVKFITKNENDGGWQRRKLVGWFWNLLESVWREAVKESQCSYHYRMWTISSWKICVLLIYAHWLFFPPASPACLQRLLLMVHEECATEDKLEISHSIEANAVRQCISEGITSKIDSRF